MKDAIQTESYKWQKKAHKGNLPSFKSGLSPLAALDIPISQERSTSTIDGTP